MDKPYKLLIIDDEAEILATFNNFFREKKYDVISASNGLDALKLIESEKEGFDLIVTDLVLPNIGGTAIIKIAKKKWPEMPIIAMTGWGEHPQALAREAQADLVLNKPFDLFTLEKKIIELIKK